MVIGDLIKKKYNGSIFGFNYNMDFDTDEQFADWLMSKLKAQIPLNLWAVIITRLLQQSDEYQTAKAKLADHEARIRALETRVGG